MKFKDILKEESDTECDKLIEKAKKLTPLLVNGEITYKEHDSIMKYVLIKKDLYYRCSKHERTDGTTERWIFPTLEVHRNHPFPFDVYVDGVKSHPNLWTDSTKKETFDHLCDHINKKCKQFGLHFASKMH